MENNEDREPQVKLIGYGTFLIRSSHGEEIFNVLGVGILKNFIRIFHPKFQQLGIFYPFAFPTKKNSSLKVLVYEIPLNALNELDFYEGIPNLFKRITSEVTLTNGETLTPEIYVPTKSTCEDLRNKLKSIMSKEELKEMWEKDLWLQYLEEIYPLVKKIYPELFEFSEDQI